MKNLKTRKTAIQILVSQAQITITINLMIEVRIIQSLVTQDQATQDQAIVLHPGQVHHLLLKVEDLKGNYEN